MTEHTDERTERLSRIRDIAARVFSAEPDVIEAAQSFKEELGGDSLLAIDFLLALEKAFAVKVEDAEIPRLMAGLESTYAVLAAQAGW